MEITINKTYLEFTEIFRSEVRPYKKNPTLFIMSSIFIKDEFVGIIDGENFWIQKTVPKFSSLQSRRFIGTVEDCGDHIKINGDFKLWLSSKLVYVMPLIIFQLILFGMLLNVIISGFDVVGITIAVSVISFFNVGLYIINRIILKNKEEKPILDFLKNI